MTALLIAIVSASIILVIFKSFPRFNINTFQAIVFNYFTAFICGIIFHKVAWNDTIANLQNWGVYSVICAVLFISLFLLIGLSSQRNGVARTSVAVKMSLAVSVFSMMVFYSEAITFLKILGIGLAFLGVYLVSKKGKAEFSKSAWMLLVLFIGSGMLDFILNVVQGMNLQPYNSSMFTAYGFLFAGIIGSVLLFVRILLKKERLEWKNCVAGIILGVPNYFSIYMLLESYATLNWNDSTVVAVLNVSIVLLSSCFGFLIFRENVTNKKVAGLTVSVLAIVVLYFAG